MVFTTSLTKMVAYHSLPVFELRQATILDRIFEHIFKFKFSEFKLVSSFERYIKNNCKEYNIKVRSWT